MSVGSGGGAGASPDLAAEVDAFISAQPLGRPPVELAARVEWLVDFQHRLHDARLAVVSWPERFGGRDLTPFQSIEVAAALGDAQAPELINFVATEVVAPALMDHATEDQLKRWLVPMAGADEVWCQLFSEPDAGSDLASLRTRAERDGDGWRITGTKLWSTWAQFAGKGLVLARTGPLDTRHRTIGAFVIDMDQAEIQVNPLTTMTGAAEFAEVVFDGAYVAADDATIAMRLLELRAANVASLLEAGSPLGAESTLTKVALTQAEQTVFAVAHELLGAGGIAWEGEEPEEVEHALYSRAASIYGGSAQIQRNVLAERHLGLPPEPRP